MLLCGSFGVSTAGTDLGAWGAGWGSVEWDFGEEALVFNTGSTGGGECVVAVG